MNVSELNLKKAEDKDLSIEEKKNCFVMRSMTDPQKAYFISPRACPHCDSIIWICTCPDFTMGRARRGINPFADPCKHVKLLMSVMSEEAKAAGEGE